MSTKVPLIPVGHKFACISLGNAYVDRVFDPVRLRQGLHILPKAPFAFDDTNWSAQVGRSTMDLFHRGELFLLATRKAQRPGILDQEIEDLRTSVNDLVAAVYLSGAGCNDGSLILAGEARTEGISVRDLGKIRAIIKHPRAIPTAVTPSVLAVAKSVFDGLQHIRSVARRGTGEFRRVGWGVMSMLRGFREDLLPERNHLFVRAVDALLKTRQGSGKKDFSARGSMLASACDIDRMLKEIYDLRSNWEHFGDWPRDWGLNGMTALEMNAQASRRTFESELIARKVYCRLLGSAELLSHFSTDKGIDAFWASLPAEISGIWGLRPDIDAIADADYDDR